MTKIPTVNIDDLQRTWALRGHPTLIRRRWQRLGVDLDSDASVQAFCETADGDEAVSLLVDLGCVENDPELTRRSDYTADRLLELFPDDRPHGDDVPLFGDEVIPS